MLRAVWVVCLVSGSISGGAASQCSDFQSAAGPTLQLRLLGFTPGGGPCGVPINLTTGLSGATWQGGLPSVVIVHGRRPPRVRPGWVGTMARELLAAHRVNVLAVDWLAPRGLGLVPAAREAGREVAQIVRTLLAHGTAAHNFHLIGFGVGAHIAGNAGGLLNGTLGRITGLDPFGPGFTDAAAGVRLDLTDAQFVDVIHTNFIHNEPIAALGTLQPLGHVDFYTGKGHQLPGCPPSLLDRERYVLCSHTQAHQLFSSSIRSSCPLVAFPCLSRLSFERGLCTTCLNGSLNSCPELGYNTSWLSADRPVMLQQLTALLDIGPAPPFCVTQFLLELQVGGVTPLKAYLFVQLKGWDVQTSSMLLTGADPVQFSPGKVYRFLVSADRDGDFSSLRLEFYTQRYLFLEWRKRRVHLSQLLLTRLPRDKGVSYYAYDVTATEGRTEEVHLAKQVVTEEEGEDEDKEEDKLWGGGTEGVRS